MTAQQHRWYLREWSAAFRVHWCGVRNGEVLARPGRPENPLRAQVLETARARIARRGGGQLNADQVRHACHILALGKDVSSWDLTNKQIDRVIAVFRALRGDNLAAIMTLDRSASEPSRRAVDHTPDADRKRVLYAIQAVDLPPQYLVALCRDKFGVGDWRGLGDRDLYQFMITAKARAAARSIAGAKRVNVAATL